MYFASGGRWGFSPQTLAKEPSALWTLIRGIRLGWRPGSRRASRACEGHGAQRVRRDAKHARLPLSVAATAVTPSPPGKGASPLLLVALGRGSPTVAPLRPCLRPPPWLREAATSCGGRRRVLLLLRSCTDAENCNVSDLSLHAGSKPRHTRHCDSTLTRAQRGRLTDAARLPADDRRNPQSCPKPPPRGSD